MLEDFFEDACVVQYVLAPDGLGDTQGTYRDGRRVKIGITQVRSSAEEIAGRDGAKTSYHLLFRPDAKLSLGDVVRRLRDGRLYRVVSVTDATPVVAREQYCIVTAEVVE